MVDDRWSCLLIFHSFDLELDGTSKKGTRRVPWWAGKSKGKGKACHKIPLSSILMIWGTFAFEEVSFHRLILELGWEAFYLQVILNLVEDESARCLHMLQVIRSPCKCDIFSSSWINSDSSCIFYEILFLLKKYLSTGLFLNWAGGARRWVLESKTR